MSSNSPTILIIGAGLTGSLCAFGLKNILPSSKIMILDKARGAGGRMSTSRTESGHKTDLGAQYITSPKQLINHYSHEYQSLLSNLILQPFSNNIPGMKPVKDDVLHFIAPGGMSQVVKHFIQTSGCTALYNSRVKEILKVENKFIFKTEEGAEEQCDIIVSTIPIPQFLALPISQTLSHDIVDNLKLVKYSTRFVLICYYHKSDKFPCVDWQSTYMDDDIIRFVSFDNLKRNQPDEPTSIVFHTTVGFGENNILKDKLDMEDVLFSHAKKLFPDWPEPYQMKCHKWLYSQVVDSYPDKPGCLKIMNDPLLILAGDAFSVSTFNGCCSSAKAVVDMMTSEFCNK